MITLRAELAKRDHMQRMMDLVRPVAGERGLDLGSGHGNTAIALAGHSLAMTALDIDPETIAEAKAHAQERGFGDRIEFIVRDLNEVLPFGDASFDVVACRAALHHVRRAPEMIHEAARVLKPGGRLSVQDPYFTERAIASWEPIAKRRESDMAGIRTLYTQIRWVQEAGLEVRSIVPFYFRRVLDEWLATAPAAVQDSIRADVASLDESVKMELHFGTEIITRKDGSEYEGIVYYYNGFELIADKPVPG